MPTKLQWSLYPYGYWSGSGSFAYKDVGEGRELGAVSFAHCDGDDPLSRAFGSDCSSEASPPLRA